MHVLGLTNLPLVFPSEARVFTTAVRIVRGSSYVLILGTSFLRSDQSVISLGPNDGSQPDPSSTWVLFLTYHCCLRVTLLARRSCVGTGQANSPQQPFQQPQPLFFPLSLRYQPQRRLHSRRRAQMNRMLILTKITLIDGGRTTMAITELSSRDSSRNSSVVRFPARFRRTSSWHSLCPYQSLVWVGRPPCAALEESNGGT